MKTNQTIATVKMIAALLLYATVLSPFLPIIALAYLCKWITPDGSAQGCRNMAAGVGSAVENLEFACSV